MSILRESLSTILLDHDRPPKEQIAIKMCKFAYGLAGCKCAKDGREPCTGPMMQAEYIYGLVESDLNAKAAAKKQAAKERAAATRSRKKHVNKIIGDVK